MSDIKKAFQDRIPTKTRSARDAAERFVKAFDFYEAAGPFYEDDEIQPIDWSDVLEELDDLKKEIEK